LGHGRIAGFFVRLPPVKRHCDWRGNWSRLVYLELWQDHPNVAVLMDVNRVMLPIAFVGHAQIEGDTLAIMHPEPLHHLEHDQPNQAFVSSDKEFIDVQNNHGNYILILDMEYEQSSVHA
jgi:hypothetical protein